MTDFYQSLWQELEKTLLLKDGRIIVGIDAQKAFKFCGIEPDDDDQIIKTKLQWGTFGKSGNEPLRYVRLIDCSTDHLIAILCNCPIGPCHRHVIRLILKDREFDLPPLPEPQTPCMIPRRFVPSDYFTPSAPRQLN